MTFKTGAQVPHPIGTLVERPWELALAPFQVAPRTYYVSGQRWVGAYLVDAGAELVLVDAGPAESLYLLLDAIWQLGFDPRCIGKIFVSPAHFDHCGAVAQLRALTGAEVWMSAEDAAFLRACPAETFGVDPRLAVFPFEPDRLYASGEPLRVGEVVFTPLLTPGHTPGCTSLFWQVTHPVTGGPLTVAMHGGAGVNTMSDAYYATSAYLTPDLRDRFIADAEGEKLRSIPVDITLPSHPNQIEILDRAGSYAPDSQPYLDRAVWPAFLDFIAARARQERGW